MALHGVRLIWQWRWWCGWRGVAWCGGGEALEVRAITLVINVASNVDIIAGSFSDWPLDGSDGAHNNHSFPFLSARIHLPFCFFPSPNMSNIYSAAPHSPAHNVSYNYSYGLALFSSLIVCVYLFVYRHAPTLISSLEFSSRLLGDRGRVGRERSRDGQRKGRMRLKGLSNNNGEEWNTQKRMVRVE